ncbi:MAG: type II secretion system protein GspD [Planctomycetes bacterium]|nr:type II secretion system protein GspD [Planctomycetota bacterium]
MQRTSASISLGWLPPWLVGTLGVLCALLAVCPSVRAGDATSLAPLSASLAKAMETRGDLSLQDATMEKALFTIGSSWHVNIVIGKDVQGTVSCIYQQAPLREVLDAILLANGYSYRAVGDSIVVQRADDVGSANPLFESAAISITHSDLQEIVDAAQLLISNQGQVQALESARSILVIDFADRVASIRQFVAQMDAAASRSTGGISTGSYKRLQVAYFHTQYIPVDHAREPIASLLSQVGRVSTMPAENRLIVVDYASNVEMVRKVLEKIDRPRPQVRITALIYDISLEDVERLGLNWNNVGSGSNQNIGNDSQQFISLKTSTEVPFQAGATGGTLTIRSLTGSFDLKTVGQLLQNANDSRLLANPNVTVVENELAEWRSVSEIPFQQITQSELGGQIGTTAFKPVGITLRVKAAIASDGTIEMQVESEFSRIAGFTEPDNQPIIDTRSATTVVRVANRQTLVIGGLRQRSDTGEFNGIPYLKDFKYFGPLFRSRDTTVRESELVVFIMPEIVDYNELARPREQMARETIGCRLARVPMAEGCPTQACEGAVSDRLLQQPYSEGELYLKPAPVSTQVRPPVAHAGRLPLRPDFDARYRASGGTGNINASRQRVDETARKPEPAEAKANFMYRLFR